MKIPVWLATVLFTAALGVGGWGFNRLCEKMDAMQSQIVSLQVDVALVKARLAPEMAQANNAHKLWVNP